MSERIPCVDDEPKVLDAYRRQFRKRFDIDIASGGVAGLSALKRQGPYAVVVADMRMPAMDGVEFLSRVHSLAPDTVKMMLTGNADQETAMEAVNRGRIFRFLTKPCPAERFAEALDAGIAQYRLVSAEHALLEQTLNGSVTLLTDLLTMLDSESFGHALHWREQAKAVALALGQSRSWEIELAAMLAHIGYVTLPPDLVARFHSGAAVTKDEQVLLDRVPEISAKLVRHVPRLEPVARAIRYQHKNFDGSGWPEDPVAGEQIPLGSRILRVITDLHRLMTADVTLDEALKQMQRHSCYDPKVLESAAKTCVDWAEQQLKPVIIETYLHRLQPGFRLVSPITAADGKLLLATDKILTAALLERLNNFAHVTRIQEPIRVDISTATAISTPARAG